MNKVVVKDNEKLIMWKNGKVPTKEGQKCEQSAIFLDIYSTSMNCDILHNISSTEVRFATNGTMQITN